ncbi:MAG: hypothetical protein ABDH34_08335 [Dictyoglomus thermophilum]
MGKNEKFIVKEEFFPDKKRMLKALCILLDIDCPIELEGGEENNETSQQTDKV